MTDGHVGASFSEVLHTNKGSVFICVRLCECKSGRRGEDEAAAKDAGEISCFRAMLPVYFSLYGPSRGGWGRRVRLGPAGEPPAGPGGPAVVRTSKLLVTTG